MAFFLSSAILVLALLGIADERQRKALLGIALAALGLVVTEALLGGLVVESQLQVSFVLIHLAIATALFGLLLVLVLLEPARAAASLDRVGATGLRRERRAAAPDGRALPGTSRGRSPDAVRIAPGRLSAPPRSADVPWSLRPLPCPVPCALSGRRTTYRSRNPASPRSSAS